jgi:hypothetical protein
MGKHEADPPKYKPVESEEAAQSETKNGGGKHSAGDHGDK